MHAISHFLFSLAVKSSALVGTAKALQVQVELDLCSRTVMCLQDVYSKE